MKKTGIELMDRGLIHGDRTAITDESGAHTYSDLLHASSSIAALLLDGRDDLGEARVCFIIDPGFMYVAAKWAVWRAGGISVPLCVFHPAAELEYVIKDCRAEIVLSDPVHVQKLEKIVCQLDITLITTDVFDKSLILSDALPVVSENRRAMILYTSGTTKRPKGVVSTHANIRAQITSLVDAWEWTEDDHIPNFLPLHHLHGILNLLLCPMWSGAKCEMIGKFDEADVWNRVVQNSFTLFMAVPTIYYRMTEYWKKQEKDRRDAMSRACSRLRLMVSGSAALPVETLEQWQEISGHVLLERYGMTETGMLLSNPLTGKRVPGYVGFPLPGVTVALFDENNDRVEGYNREGEIRVRGDNVFLEYWEREKDTKEAFCTGWFKTGDIAIRNDNGYRILGRDSVDIIKYGGYKLSALEIEEQLLYHPAVKQCAVVGIPDIEWGERPVVAIVAETGQEPALDHIRNWASSRLAKYKLPHKIIVVEELPRNVMGKVVKSEVKKLFEQD